jgi:hypothetical protein
MKHVVDLVGSEGRRKAQGTRHATHGITRLWTARKSNAGKAEDTQKKQKAIGVAVFY